MPKRVFPKAVRLTKRREFEKLSRIGYRRAGRWLLLETALRPSSLESVVTSRLGVTVSRKYGKSHERNRFKRLVREAFRHILALFIQPLEINVRPRGKCPLPSNAPKMQDICADLQDILRDYLKK